MHCGVGSAAFWRFDACCRSWRRGNGNTDAAFRLVASTHKWSVAASAPAASVHHAYLIRWFFFGELPDSGRWRLPRPDVLPIRGLLGRLRFNGMEPSFSITLITSSAMYAAVPGVKFEQAHERSRHLPISPGLPVVPLALETASADHGSRRASSVWATL